MVSFPVNGQPETMQLITERRGGYMLDGEAVVQADGDIYIVRQADDGKSEWLRWFLLANLGWMLAFGWGVLAIHDHAAEEIKAIVAEEVPAQVRLVLMP